MKQNNDWSFPCAETSSSSQLGESALNVPCQYDKKYRINVTLKNRDVDDFIKKGKLAGKY